MDLYKTRNPFRLIRAGLLDKLQALESALASEGTSITEIATRIGAKVNSLSALKSLTFSKLADEQVYVVAGSAGEAPRVYVWDADSTAVADEDYIVAHNSAPETGRFIRLAAKPLHNHDDAYYGKAYLDTALNARLQLYNIAFTVTVPTTPVQIGVLPSGAIIHDALLAIETPGPAGSTISIGGGTNADEIFSAADASAQGPVELAPGWDAVNSVLTLGNMGSEIAILVASDHAFVKTPFPAEEGLGGSQVYAKASGDPGTVIGRLFLTITVWWR